MRIILCFVILFCYLSGYSQIGNRTDSLHLLLKTKTNNKEKLILYCDLFTHLKDDDSLKSVEYALKGIDLAKSIGQDSIAMSLQYDLGWSLMLWGNLSASKKQFQNLISFSKEQNLTKGQASGYKGLGDVYRIEAKYEKALQSYKNAVAKWEQIQDLKGLGYTYNNIGVVFRTQSNTPLALEYYLKAVDILERIQDARGIGYISSNIGNIYYEKGDYPKSIEFHQKAIRYNKEIQDQKGIALSLNNIGLVKVEQGELKGAMSFFHQSLKINKELNNKEGIALVHINLAETFLDEDNTDSAEFYYSEISQTVINTSDRQSETYVLLGLAEVNYRKGKITKARALLKEGIRLAKEINYLKNVVLGAEKLVKVETELGHFKEALDAHILFKKVSDQLYNEEETEKYVRVQAENEFQMERDSVAFAQEKERLIFETEIAKKSTNLRLSAIAIALILLVILVIIFYNRRLQTLNAKLTDRSKELEQLNKTKSRLFSIVAHDLRGPMSIMIGYGDLIKRDLDQRLDLQKEDSLNEMFQYQKESSDSVLELLDGLLTWAIKEEGGFKPKIEILNLKERVDESLDIFKHSAMSKHIDLVSDVDENHVVLVDKNSLMTILRNLISNALKFTPENGAVSIFSSELGDQTVIKVQDSGVGIPSNKLEDLFKVDDRKSTRGTGGERGTGLGLNLVYDFVTLNKGTVQVESTEGKGTVFTLIFPNKV